MERLLIAFASFAFFWMGISAHAYTPSLTQAGKPIRWKGETHLRFAGNPENRSNLGSGDVYAAAVKGLQRWNAASEGMVRFDYWQGADRATYEPNSNYNGLSSIYFASSGSAGDLSPNVIGLTQVWYDSDSGRILETDIVLNDIDYQFTLNPKDTSAFGASERSSRKVFIENVLTHELGHALGLSHSGGLQSTMLFMESPEQAHLGCDEQIGIRAVYPPASLEHRGLITGRVVSEAGSGPVFGAHVLAISRRRGTVLATAITDPSGRYVLSGLESGEYYLMAEPFFAGASALPAFYSGISPFVCGTQAFSRSLLTSGASQAPQAVRVNPGAITSTPELVAQCRPEWGAAVSSNALSSGLSTAPMIFDGTNQGGGVGGFGFVDRFQGSNTLYYRMRALEGKLEVSALSYSLYSPVKPTLRLLDSYGNRISADITENVFQGQSGYVNYDSKLVAESLQGGEYILEVSGAPLNASVYPAGPLSLDSVPFLVLTGSVNEGAPPLSAIMPDNARCRMEENFPAYTSPPGPPPRRFLESEEEKVGFCGTLASSDSEGGGGSSGPGPSAAAIIGWFLPFGFLAALRFRLRVLRYAANV